MSTPSREQIEQWRQQAKEAMDAEYTASGSAEIAAHVYDAKLIELAWQAALEEAWFACNQLAIRAGDAMECADAINAFAEKEPQP